MAKYLFKNEIMDREQFELCFEPDVTEEMLDTVSEKKKKAADEENQSRREELDKKNENKSPFDNSDVDNNAFAEDIFNQ